MEEAHDGIEEVQEVYEKVVEEHTCPFPLEDVQVPKQSKGFLVNISQRALFIEVMTLCSLKWPVRKVKDVTTFLISCHEWKCKLASEKQFVCR